MKKQLYFFRCIFNFLITRHQFSVTADFIPVFPCYEQHTKTFTLVTVKVPVMHFMRPPDGPDIPVITAGEPFEPLVNDDIMHQEISKAISHDPKTDRLHPPYMIVCAKPYQQHTRNRKDDKEGIILFKEARFYLVMVSVQIPEKPVHYIPVRKPGNAFHSDERYQKDQYVKNYCHQVTLCHYAFIMQLPPFFYPGKSEMKPLCKFLRVFF
jgi:hypothetical protein